MSPALQETLQTIQVVLQQSYLGNTIRDYLIFCLTLLVGLYTARILRGLVSNGLKRWAKRTPTPLDDILLEICEDKLAPVFYLGVFYLSFLSLRLHPVLKQFIDSASVILLAFFVTRFTLSLIEHVFIYRLEHAATSKTNLAVKAMFPILRVIFWCVAVIFVLDNLGLNVAAIVASLGVGSIAIALASQGVLVDLFAYFTILLDRPFEVGDFLIVGDMEGKVESIGIKTTRIRSLDGEQIIVSNKDLTDSRVHNFRRMENRRIVFQIGVKYDTPAAKVARIPDILRESVQSTPDVTFDRAHFASYGDFSLNFETVYFVLTNDYARYMDVQQEINMKIMDAFDRDKIEFAYPTQVLYHAKLSDAKLS